MNNKIALKANQRELDDIIPFKIDESSRKLSMQINDYVRNIDLDLILIFSFQVIVIMCMGFIGWLWIMSKYSASSTSSFAFLTPIFGVLFGWLIMDDPINKQIYLSLFFTCLGIYLINKKGSKLV